MSPQEEKSNCCICWFGRHNVSYTAAFSVRQDVVWSPSENSAARRANTLLESLTEDKVVQNSTITRGLNTDSLSKTPTRHGDIKLNTAITWKVIQNPDIRKKFRDKLAEKVIKHTRV